MGYEYIELEQSQSTQCATLRLKRPPSNLLNIAMLDEMNAALHSLRGQPWLEVLVLRGAESTFSDGFDLGDHTPDRAQRLMQVFVRFFETIRLVDVIAVAAVEGQAWGAGFELALGCNLIVAASDSSFALPQTRQGLFPPVAAAILPRIAPRRRAMEWILTGEEISVKRLEHDGVVNRIFATGSFSEDLAAFISRITSMSGPVLQLAKRAQFESYYSAFPDALQTIQSMYLRELTALADAAEGTAAAREGRAPVWKNA
ncbi:MAG TPA: enoyl-CoA hydratase/isomerase family protein [Longimicrobiales bacterium]|nr:enoyl-CoA hydratase/isomerase family protein [Longimicrobiales bacterium]